MNVLCQRCNQAKATVHITDTIPTKRERHLCEQCAETEGVIIKQDPPAANDLIKQFIKHKSGGGEAAELRCPKCNLSFRDFQLKGLLGCPHDYDAFRAALLPLISRAHEGASQHTGKVPVTADEALVRQTGLLRLRRELQDALDQENYERAATVRDQIAEMESP